MKYLRPKTIEEAVALLDEGIPLAGGSALSVDRYHLDGVIDLQELALDQIRIDGDRLLIGAMTTLQALLDSELSLPDVIRKSCRYEAAWNLRNQMTLGGVLLEGDGRSPLLTVLSVLEPEFRIVPGDDVITLDELFERRAAQPRKFIVLEMHVNLPGCLAYDYVARAPMDSPIVSAAAALIKEENEQRINIAIGGHAERPVFWAVETTGDESNVLDQVVEQAETRLEHAGDAFASAAYRAEIAGVLSRRVVSEVITTC